MVELNVGVPALLPCSGSARTPTSSAAPWRAEQGSGGVGVVVMMLPPRSATTSTRPTAPYSQEGIVVVASELTFAPGFAFASTPVPRRARMGGGGGRGRRWRTDAEEGRRMGRGLGRGVGASGRGKGLQGHLKATALAASSSRTTTLNTLTANHFHDTCPFLLSLVLTRADICHIFSRKFSAWHGRIPSLFISRAGGRPRLPAETPAASAVASAKDSWSSAFGGGG